MKAEKDAKLIEQAQANAKSNPSQAIEDKLTEERKRHTAEFNAKMKEINDKGSAAEQIRLLKQAVTHAKQQNKVMITRKDKAKVQTEKTQKDIAEAKLASSQPIPAPKPIVQDNDLEEEYRLLLHTGSRVKGIPGKPGKAGAKKFNMFDQSNSFCGCGATNPEHKGYCLKCVQQLKDKFTELLAKLEAAKENYEDFNDDKKAQSEDKLAMMRAKAEQYQIQITDGAMFDLMDTHTKLMDGDANRAFAELQVTVHAMKQELLIKKSKQAIETEDFEKEKDWFTEKIAAEKRKRQDVEIDLAKFLYEFDHVNTEMDAIDKRLYLKTRYVKVQEQIKQMKAEKAAKDADYAGKLKREQQAFNF